MAWYRTGTVAVTNGSKTVTGTSAAWVNNVQPGDAFVGPDGAYNEVDQVVSNTSILLVENYAGTTVASGGAYKIIPTQGRMRDLAAPVLQLVTDYGALNSALTVNSTNIGIGTAGATSKLTVAGDMRALAGGALILNDPGNSAAGSILFDAANALVFRRGGSVEVLRIDSSGNMGLGVSPVAGYGRTLAISQGTGTAHPILLHQAADTNDERLYLNNNAAPPAGGFTGTFNYNKSGCAATAYLQRAGAHSWFTAPPGTAGAPVTLVERLKIKPTGGVWFVPLTADPASPDAGEFYFNSATSKFRGYTGAGWVDLH